MKVIAVEFAESRAKSEVKIIYFFSVKLDIDSDDINK